MPDTKRPTCRHEIHIGILPARRASRVMYQLDLAGPQPTNPVVVRDDFDSETATYKGSIDGWLPMLSSRKTLLESGQPLTTAPVIG